MKLVTDKWRRRDGKPLIAVYQYADGSMISVADQEHWSHRVGGRRDDFSSSPCDLLPVPREPVYRPFLDLAEAFAVMGQPLWIHIKGSNTWALVTATSKGLRGDFGIYIDGEHLGLAEMLQDYEYTNNPSDKTGKPCGVEVTE